jgi:hypothetical protein
VAEGPEREHLLEAEVKRLGREIAILDRQWNLKYRLAFLGLLAIPLYFVAGRFWAVIIVLMTPALVATQAYLLAVRRTEARELLDDAKRYLKASRAKKPAAEPS